MFLVYPNLIPPKSGPADFGGPPNALANAGAAGATPTIGGAAGAIGEAGRIRRSRVREEPEPAEGSTDHISTSKVALKAERYRPKIYGFQVHETAKLQRWQEAVRDRQVARLDVLEEAKKM